MANFLKNFIVGIYILSLNALASPTDVNNKLKELIQDGHLSLADVKTLKQAAGEKLHPDESMAIYKAVIHPQNYSVDKAEILDYALYEDLDESSIQALKNATSFADIEFKDKTQFAKLREKLALARLSGAAAFNVGEYEKRKSGPPRFVWTRYPGLKAEEATGNMSFSYTQITPERLIQDMNSKLILGNDKEGKHKEWQRYTTGNYYADIQINTGTGSTFAAYRPDHPHTNPWARGMYNQKWTNNCAILVDLTLHCLPASRKHSDGFGASPLTNPALARGKKVLWFGHIEIARGIVQRVTTSGRPSKRIAQGRKVLINPVSILKELGFHTIPNLKTGFANHRHGTPVIDEKTATMRRRAAAN